MEKNYDTNVAVKKESNKVVNVVVVVLVVLLVSLSCYIVYSKFILDTSNSNENQNNPVEEKPKDPAEVPDEPEEVPFSKELAFELYNMLYRDIGNCGTELLDYYARDKLTVEELSDYEKERIVVEMLLKEKNDFSHNEISFTKQQIMDMKDKVLGKDTSFEIENVDDCRRFYEASKDIYTVGVACGGEMCFPRFLGEIIKAVQVDDMVYIDQRLVFPDIPMEIIDNPKLSFKVYKDKEGRILLGEATLKEVRDYTTLRSNVNDAMDTSDFVEQARVYRFTFRQNGDYYSFVQIERIK